MWLELANFNITAGIGGRLKIEGQVVGVVESTPAPATSGAVLVVEGGDRRLYVRIDEYARMELSAEVVGGIAWPPASPARQSSPRQDDGEAPGSWRERPSLL